MKVFYYYNFLILKIINLINKKYYNGGVFIIINFLILKIINLINKKYYNGGIKLKYKKLY